MYPKPIKDFIDKFSRLPGIGPRQAARLAFWLLNGEKNITWPGKVKYFALTDARDILSQLILRDNPPQSVRDAIEAYYRQYGVEPIELPRAA